MFKQKFSSLLNFNKFKRGFTSIPKFDVSWLRQQGFTLIELLVVISIIGFLVVASVVVFNIVRMNAIGMRLE